MNEETIKYIQRVITRNKEILDLSPWHVRDALKDFTKQLEKIINDLPAKV